VAKEKLLDAGAFTDAVAEMRLASKKFVEAVEHIISMARTELNDLPRSEIGGDS
jgi:hypothetical protein